jgi:O-antigen/teichoic acid export membrane protein
MFYVAAIMIMKSLAGLITLKVQATLLLPDNFAVLSQFMTVAGLVTNISSAAVTSGMTVLLARAGTAKSAIELIQSGRMFSAGLSLIISVMCVILYFFGGDLINIKPLPRYLFLILALSPWLITQSSIAQAQLTSSFLLNRFTKLSNASNIAIALIIVTLTYYFGLTGSAIAVAIGPMLTAIILLLFAVKKGFVSNSIRSKEDYDYHISELVRFSAAMFVAVCAVPISHILIRESMVNAGSITQAGYWSATVRLSDVYMQFFGLLLTFYVLPKISSKIALAGSKRLFVSYLGRLALISAGVLGLVFILREYIVMLTLAPEFRPTISLLKTQLLGDFFRIVVSFFFWFSYGQNLRVLAAAEEIMQASLFYIFFRFVITGNDAQGAVEAHFFASITNAIIIGTCLFFVLSRRRQE